MSPGTARARMRSGQARICPPKRSGRKPRAARMGASTPGAIISRTQPWPITTRTWGSTTPVGSYPAGASPYGVLDMAGNVWEWCADWFGEAYYAKSPPKNPTGPSSGDTRVVRGGSWVDGDWVPAGCCTATGHDPDNWDGDQGFRCCRREALP